MVDHSHMGDNFYVGALILNPRDEILLQRKDLGYPKIQFAGMWTTFGGEGKSGETPEEAFHREVIKEETGLDGLTDINLAEKYFIDERNFGITHNPSIGLCFFYSARFDGDKSKLRLGEGAGFSVFAESELEKHVEGNCFPYVYDVIQRFYASLKS